jgi:hypothetical protein
MPSPEDIAHNDEVAGDHGGETADKSFPDRAALAGALDIAARAPSLRNLQPWRWHVDDAGVHLYADWRRRAGDGQADRRDVLLGCGAVLDHCAMALAVAGWTPRVRRVSRPDRDGPLAILEVVDQPPANSTWNWQRR